MTIETTSKTDAEKIPESLARRGFMKIASMSAAASLMAGVSPGLRNSAWAAGQDGLEKSKLTFGIIPLTDCAPIVVAKEKGFFKKHGLDVTVSKEASWANIRDKVSLGELDGAHMLAGDANRRNVWRKCNTKRYSYRFFYGFKWQWHHCIE